MPIRWFLTPERLPSANMRLFCLPYAGGGAAVYRSWAKLLAPTVELYAVELPGHGWRWQEPTNPDLLHLAGEIAAAIEAEADRPFALFGHSMGAWLGLEVVRQLEAVSRRPVTFLASGRQAPSLGCRLPQLSVLDDAAFLQAVQERYGGIPPQIHAEPGLLNMFLPSLRADITLLERYQHRPAAPIAAPIHALLGAQDSVVRVDDLAPWAQETSGAFVSTFLPGGHFYFQPDPSALVAVLHRMLSPTRGP
jgi:surfactin synthase thioesterase subunit